MDVLKKSCCYYSKSKSSLYAYPLYLTEAGTVIFFEFSLEPFKGAKVSELSTANFKTEFEEADSGINEEAERRLFGTESNKNIVIKSFESDEDLHKFAKEESTHGSALIDAIKNAKSAYKSFLSGLLKVSKGFYRLALADWREALMRNPDYSLTYYYLGDYYFREGDFKRAYENYKSAYEKYREKDWLKSLIRNNYGCSCLRLAIENLGRQDRNLEEIKKLLELSLSLFNEATNLDEEIVANFIAAYLFLGNTLYQLRDPRAENMYKEALSLGNLFSDKAQVLLNEGAVYHQQAVVLRESGKNPLEIVAKLKGALQKYEEAERLAKEKAKDLLPSIYYNLSTIWSEKSEMRDFNKSCEYIEKAIETALENNQEIPEYYYSQLTKTHLHAGKLEVARSSYLMGIRARQISQNIKRKIKEANKYCDKGLLDEAKEIYKEVLETDKNNPEALSGLGFCYEKEGRYEEAIQQYEKVLLLSAETLDVLKRTIKCYIERAQYGKALECCEKLLCVTGVDVKEYERHKNEVLDEYFKSVFSSGCWDKLDGETKEHLKIAESEYYRLSQIEGSNYSHPLLRLALAVEAEFNHFIRAALFRFLKERRHDPGKLSDYIQWSTSTTTGLSLSFDIDKFNLRNYLDLLDKRIGPKNVSGIAVRDAMLDFLARRDIQGQRLKNLLNSGVLGQGSFVDLRNRSAHSNFWVGNYITKREILRARELILDIDEKGQRKNPAQLNAIELIFSMI